MRSNQNCQLLIFNKKKNKKKKRQEKKMTANKQNEITMTIINVTSIIQSICVNLCDIDRQIMYGTTRLKYFKITFGNESFHLVFRNQLVTGD